MNIQITTPQNPSFFSQQAASSPRAQLISMMLSMMMSLLNQAQGQGMMPQTSPGFGCCQPTGNSSHPALQSGGMPGFSNFSGAGHCPSPSGLGGSTDNYVPQGSHQSGQIENLGSGSGSDAVRWALGKEGISESNNPGAVREISRGAWQPWCADFVSQAYANSPGGSPFGHQSSVAGILAWGRENNRFFDAGTASGNPSMLRPGDVAVWKSNGKSHVGLVTGINANGTFNTIEGNTSDAVRRRTHSFGGGLTGFVRPRG